MRFSLSRVRLPTYCPSRRNADAVRKFIHFRHAVADIDDRHPFIAQAQNPVQTGGGFPREERRWVHPSRQNAAVAVQRAGNFHLLLLDDGQLHHRVGGVELCRRGAQSPPAPGSHLFALHHPAARIVRCQKDNFRQRSGWARVHLLDKSGNACSQRIFRPFNVKRLDRRSGSRRWWRHRRPRGFSSACFSRAVFTHQRVDLSGKRPSNPHP